MKKMLITFLLIFFLSSCNLPATPTEAPIGAIKTAVAETLVRLSSKTPELSGIYELKSTMSPTSELANTATPTLTHTNTSTVSSENPKNTLGTPAWTSNLDDTKSWYQDDDEYTVIESKPGALVLKSLQPVGWHGWSMHYRILEDFYLEAVIRVNNCASADRYGIAFRSPDYTKGYYFGLTCNGDYLLNKNDGSKFVPIINPTKSNNINPGSGQSNIIGAKMIKSRLSFYINNKLIQEIDDGSYDKGTFGIFIAAFTTPGFSVELDEISYWIIK